jgi:hypothetical protein
MACPKGAFVCRSALFDGSSACARAGFGSSSFVGSSRPFQSNRPASYPYAATTALNDVVPGSDGFCGGSYLCTSGVGYDGATGLGSPKRAAAFSAAPSSPPPTVPSAPLGAGAVATRLSATSVSDHGLIDGVAYYYVVEAVNSVAPSPSWNEASATPVLTTGLGPPLHLVAVRGTRRRAALPWSVATNNGASPITGYRVYRGLAPDTETLCTTASRATATCVAADTSTHRATYYYQVVRVGPLSNRRLLWPLDCSHD